MKKLETIGFDTKKDLLISVGDLVDRGTENVECLELITFPWFRAVRGNHEQMMIDGLSERGNVNHWMLNGGGWFFNIDYDKEILAKDLAHKADELPLIIELVSKDKKYVICHADYRGNTVVWQSSKEILRQRYCKCSQHSLMRIIAVVPRRRAQDAEIATVQAVRLI